MDSADTSPDPWACFNFFQKMTTAPLSAVMAHPPEDHLLAWNAGTSRSTTATQSPSRGSRTPAAWPITRSCASNTNATAVPGGGVRTPRGDTDAQELWPTPDGLWACGAGLGFVRQQQLA